MTPDQVNQLREDIRLGQVQTAQNFKDLDKQVGRISVSVSAINQWMKDKACDKHEILLNEHDDAIHDLKLKDIERYGQIQVKFGIWQFSAMVLAGLVVMVPLGFAMFHYLSGVQK